MKRFRYAGILVQVETDEGLPDFALPYAMTLDSGSDDAPHIVIRLSVGTLQAEVPDGPVRLIRGGMEARGDQERMLWTHREMGPMIEVFPRQGIINATLPSWAWTRVNDVFDQLLLPGLLPAFAARGLRAFHASAVELNGVGVFVAGPSGSGKTTAALLLISHGANLIADDLMFLYREEGRAVISGIGDGLRAHSDVWERFGHLRPSKVESSGKLRLEHGNVPWVRSATPRVGVLLDPEREPGRIQAAQALPRLLSLCYHAGDEEATLRMLAELSRDVLLFSAENAERAATIAVQPEESA